MLEAAAGEHLESEMAYVIHAVADVIDDSDVEMRLGDIDCHHRSKFETV